MDDRNCCEAGCAPKSPALGEIWSCRTSNLVYVNVGPGRSISIACSDGERVPLCDAPPSAQAPLLSRCYHKCRTIFSWQFFAGITLSFPIEHALWTKVAPFAWLAGKLGLSIGH